MASNITVQASLSVFQGNLQYQSRPGAFRPSMSGTNGPTPGAVTVPVSGVDISFAQLDAMGGLGRFFNIDATNFITVGLRDKVTNVFYPFGDILPGEFYIWRLSSKLPKDEAGTGTFSGTNVTVHAKTNTNASNASAILVVEFFDP